MQKKKMQKKQGVYIIINTIFISFIVSLKNGTGTLYFMQEVGTELIEISNPVPG